ncbi:MATE family efflux transporter [Clostridium sp. AF18-27]|uniref:MATE family efflux transporter n=1 Tax=Enterocloster lavalensis TaxID=460384 RepID=UPI000E4A82B6|nr:MATE family efflux transporter [Enterocloster lavalensis]MBS5605191.1 MATE family efflux transporter [Enterocloster asparagiformis]MCB6345368.1 MATE family efflux transporter [Enterocloster lavalensis]RHR52683.1 MATE family efflux transporter [Clostridium sp. AF18-27]
MRITLVKEKAFYTSVLSIMLPVALQQAINMGVNMLDTMMLGSFGEVQLSASSLANQYYAFFSVLCMGIIGGSSVLAAQYWGAGNSEKVRETFSMALRLALGAALFFTVLTLLIPDRIMRIYTSEQAVIDQGVRYLRITAFIFAIHGTGLVAAQLMRSVGQAKLGLVVSIISFVVNILANYIFIFGKFGAPRMEIAGAALGTLLARTAEFAATFLYILVIDKKLRLRPRHLLISPSSAFYKSYFRLGAPVLVSDALLGLGGNIVSVVLGHMGAAVVAGNAICQVIDRLCTVVISGISNASGIITGNTIGLGDKKRAIEQGETFYLLSIIFGAVGSVLIFLLGPLTISLYRVSPETIRITRQLMNAYVIIIFFQAVQSVMTKGVLRGGGDTRFLMKADILFMWLVSIPLGIASGLIFGWPAWLTMLCLRADYVIKSIWCVSRLMSGKWIHEADGLREIKSL